ncbi:NUMOD4 domain-containing protein [Achromobacter denitrificans]
MTPLTERQATDVAIDPMAGTLGRNALQCQARGCDGCSVCKLDEIVKSDSFARAQGEEWRPVVGWPEYEVSSHGRVRRVAPYVSTRSGRLLRPKPSNAYFRVGLSRKSRVTWKFVHRLVAEAFLPAPMPGQTQVAHNNGVGIDNRVSNLRWDSPQGNAADRWAHGTYRTGERHASAKGSWLLAKRVREMRAGGAKVQQIMCETGLGRTSVYSILRGDRWGTPGPKGQAHIPALEKKA